MGNTGHLVDTIHAIRDETWEEFVRMGDFFFKVPNFLTHLENEEFAKLERYFGHDEVLQEMRWEHEAPSLERTFPKLIANSCLFCLVSYFEWSLHRLADTLQSHAASSVNPTHPGKRIHANDLLRHYGVEMKKTEWWPQVYAATKLRNCLIHANGLLAYTDKPDRIREIVENRQYYAAHDQSKTAVDFAIRIVAGPLGEQVILPINYPHTAMPYFSRHFMQLCDEVVSKISS